MIFNWVSSLVELFQYCPFFLACEILTFLDTYCLCFILCLLFEHNCFFVLNPYSVITVAYKVLTDCCLMCMPSCKPMANNVWTTIIRYCSWIAGKCCLTGSQVHQLGPTSTSNMEKSFLFQETTVGLVRVKLTPDRQTQDHKPDELTFQLHSSTIAGILNEQYPVSQKQIHVLIKTISQYLFAGCGRHIELVLRGVPEDNRCKCKRDSKSCAIQQTALRPTFFIQNCKYFEKKKYLAPSSVSAYVRIHGCACECMCVRLRKKSRY